MSPQSLDRQRANPLRKRLGFHKDGWVRATLLHLGILAAFGVFLPGWKGLEFFDPTILTAYACLGAVLAAPVAAYKRDEMAPTTADAVVRILWSAAYGHLVSWALLATGIATVYLTHLHSAFFPPDLLVLAAGLGLGLSFALALAAISAWASLQFSEQAARLVLRLVFLGLLLGFFYSGRRLPDLTMQATWVLLAAAAAILVLLRRAVARRRQGAV